MAARTGIQWCDSTANYWEGCTKVSTEEQGGGGCDNCYAESMNNWLHRGENWGPGAPRLKFGTTSRIVRSWQRNAEKFRAQHGRRRRVFINSTADTFDNEVEQAWREEIYADARDCLDLLFYWVTKRIGNAKHMLPADWGDGYPNVMLLATVVNQPEADRDVHKLLALPARWRGLSVEPQLGAIDLTDVRVGGGHGHHEFDPIITGNALTRPSSRIDLVINGGESSRKARPLHPDHARSLRDQCAAAGTPYFFKQWGEWVPMMGHAQGVPVRGKKFTHPDGTVMGKAGKEAAGRLLDGREHNDFPKDFQ